MTADPVQTWVSRSVEDTLTFGRRLGECLAGGDVIALVGPLGAGKTHLVKGIAAGNGLTAPHQVTSPTFILVNEHPGRLHLYHLDLYRIRQEAEITALGLEEMIAPDSAVVVEWADRFPSAFPDDSLWIQINPGAGLQERMLRLEARGPRSRELLERLAGRLPQPPVADP